MGHVLGLEDYYDYNSDANSPFDKNFWAGAYSMQDFNVGGHDPYSIISLGWANPYVPTETITYTIRPFESSGDVIMLTPDFTNSAFDEYILIELYTPTGVNERDTKYQYSGRYPVGPTTAGIRIWHVDSRLIIPSGPTTDRDGNTYYTRSTISTSIDKTSLYCLGPTNTTYKRGGSNNGYSTLYPELRNYHLLELIRNEDYMHTRYNDEIANSDLFKTGSTFTFNDYSKYFTRTDGGIFSSNKVMNNGKTLGFTVSIDSVNSSRAIVTVTKQ